ncbi:N-ethylmaleimide reductase [Streptomyces zhaozhouensis]|uniref:N-ethylmaleimide reductase n=1 Tax=Streptomyces zhaozhouensis TaxID=1300267 RepID=A0A286E0D8_9ACTN|nr:alkene reductase [Streptomyces zhaozhouensis]SOD64353.1 N-ethylmaleimide reductase [Streptomyces zhaozhouensis]
MPHPTSVPDVQPLLRPVRLGALRLPNRVVMAPMTRARADNEELAPTALHAAYYAQRAGAGLIVSEGTWVSDDAIGFVHVPGIYTDAQIAGWARTTEAVHSAGGRIVSQLGHAGAVSHPDHHGGRLPAGPSAINPRETAFTPDGPKESVTPRAMTAAEIAGTIDAFRQAAANALRAGFDGLEIHAQVSHLVAQFLNPRLNRRTDAYGGSAEKRARFLLDVVDAVSGVWGADRVGVKLSPYWNGGPAFAADAEQLADYDRLLGRLDDSGLAYLHLLGPEPGTGTDDALTAFTRYRSHYRGAIVANLGLTRASGNELLERRLADAVSFGAPFIANPDLVDRFAQGHPLAVANRDTYYAGGPRGYTDYPAVTAGRPPVP